ncbi:MAG TPA: hypothetical protein VK348_01625 [Planctomycetota bacterium]|nr:hypothetical protein [Planctomycetota bacterium]
MLDQIAEQDPDLARKPVPQPPPRPPASDRQNAPWRRKKPDPGAVLDRGQDAPTVRPPWRTITDPPPV